ncbi:MAG: S-4TM family putative pore-forming effector [Mariprofundus sp.]
MHSILETQNQPLQKKRLRAQRRLYDEVRFRKSVRIWSVILLNAFWIIYATLVLQSNLFLVAGSGLLVITEILLEKLWQEPVHRKAVLIQELFDTHVLKLTWNDNVHEIPPPVDYVALWSDRYDEQKYSKAPLENWYSPEVGQVPLEYGRLCCQFSNIDWDVSLRSRYIRWFVFLTACVVATALVLLIVFGEKVINQYWFLIACILPPGRILWAETTRNLDSIRNLRSIRQRMELKWRDVLTGQLPVATLETAARDWQQLIFNHRLLSPVLPGHYYLRIRPEEETKMNKGCKALVEEVLRALKNLEGD